jgi:hypothetical protein
VPLDVPVEVSLDVPVDVPLDVPVEVPLDVAGVDATVVAEDEEVADEAFLARAGSCPDTSTIAISSHAATNNATDPATIRRRMVRARAARALLSASPRARAAAALVSLMSCTSFCRSDSGVEASRGSFRAAHISRVRDG